MYLPRLSVQHHQTPPFAKFLAGSAIQADDEMRGNLSISENLNSSMGLTMLVLLDLQDVDYAATYSQYKVCGSGERRVVFALKD